MAETPFKISIPNERIDDLKQRLALTTFPDELDAGWEYGVPLSDMRRLIARWKDGYDWRKHEAALNDELPQFTRDIEVDDHGALNVHYVHKKCDVEGAIPLLFVHGCKRIVWTFIWMMLNHLVNNSFHLPGPGSFIEVKKILPLLVRGSAEHPAFNVAAVGLPGYGFLEGPKKKGFGPAQYAEVRVSSCSSSSIFLIFLCYIGRP